MTSECAILRCGPAAGSDHESGIYVKKFISQPPSCSCDIKKIPPPRLRVDHTHGRRLYIKLQTKIARSEKSTATLKSPRPPPIDPRVLGEGVSRGEGRSQGGGGGRWRSLLHLGEEKAFADERAIRTLYRAALHQTRPSHLILTYIYITHASVYPLYSPHDDLAPLPPSPAPPAGGPRCRRRAGARLHCCSVSAKLFNHTFLDLGFIRPPPPLRGFARVGFFLFSLGVVIYTYLSLKCSHTDAPDQVTSETGKLRCFVRHGASGMAEVKQRIGQSISGT
ncbi:hypothetical protein EVAR_97469_1 [Eumeta japonica]|uniref:Uncharacterized protein n=1 Tax=Eumeta variegata TaxID=151549 RepID=A0A4C1X153_EUMVA|nr:hypothetical protein EVAR_97469_1 [Eumeta japonica]